jgi:hypothetical protein
MMQWFHRVIGLEDISDSGDRCVGVEEWGFQQGDLDGLSRAAEM